MSKGDRRRGSQSDTGVPGEGRAVPHSSGEGEGGVRMEGVRWGGGVKGGVRHMHPGLQQNAEPTTNPWPLEGAPGSARAHRARPGRLRC